MRAFIIRRIHVLAGALAAILVVVVGGGCGDHCGDVVCAPAPLPLQVQVYDTMTVDTQLVVLRGTPAVADTVDTVLVVSRITTNVVVTLDSVAGADTVAFDTLEHDNSVNFWRQDFAGLPSSPMILVADRGGRRVKQPGLTVQTVEGCCGYRVIGFYRLSLPEKPAQ